MRQGKGKSKIRLARKGLMKRLEHRKRRVPQPRQHVCQPVENINAVCAAKTGYSQFVTHHHCVERVLQGIAIPSAAAAAAAVIVNICSWSYLRIEMRKYCQRENTVNLGGVCSALEVRHVIVFKLEFVQ